MKYRNQIALLMLGCVAFLSSAFVEPNNTISIAAAPSYKAPSFVEFLSHFEKVETPFEVGLDDFEKYENRKATNWPTKKSAKRSAKRSKKNTSGEETQVLWHFLPTETMMSRMGPPSLMPIARFYPNEETVAIIYMSYRARSSFGSTYKLALFNLKGERLPKATNAQLRTPQTYFLGQNSPYGPTQTFSIDKNGQVVQKSYKAIWKNDVKKNGIKNNEITDYVLEKTEFFEIGENGMVAKADQNSTDRASVDFE